MHTFTMLETAEARTVANSTVQVLDAIICCLALQGTDLAQLLEDLDVYRALKKDSGTLEPVADEMLSRSILSLTHTLRDMPQKNV